MPLIDRYDDLPDAEVKAALRQLLLVATSPAFGAVSKRELELALFEMLRELGLIGKKASLFSLMTELRVTRAKASQLLFDIEVRGRGDNPDALDDEVRDALKATRFAKDGEFFVLEIENPLVLAHLRDRLRGLGHVSDTSFNAAIVRMPLDAVTDLIVSLIPEDSRAGVRQALIRAGAPDNSIKGVLTNALKTLGAKVVGDAADGLAQGVVNQASAFLGPIFTGAQAAITENWSAVLRQPDQDR